MSEFSKHKPGDIDNPFPVNALFRRGTELLIIKVVDDCLEHTREIDCDEVQFESNELELKITYLFTGMRIEETSLPGFYHDHLRKAVGEFEAPDRGDVGTREAWGFGVLRNATSFRGTVDEVGETDNRIAFSTIYSE